MPWPPRTKSQVGSPYAPRGGRLSCCTHQSPLQPPRTPRPTALGHHTAPGAADQPGRAGAAVLEPRLAHLRRLERPTAPPADQQLHHSPTPRHAPSERQPNPAPPPPAGGLPPARADPRQPARAGCADGGALLARAHRRGAESTPLSPHLLRHPPPACPLGASAELSAVAAGRRPSTGVTARTLARIGREYRRQRAAVPWPPSINSQVCAIRAPQTGQLKAPAASRILRRQRRPDPDVRCSPTRAGPAGQAAQSAARLARLHRPGRRICEAL